MQSTQGQQQQQAQGYAGNMQQQGCPTQGISQVQGDPVSPTRVEQGLGAQNETPLPPSTPSTGSRRGVGGVEGRLPQSQMPPGFQGPMFDWSNASQMPSFMPGTGQIPSQRQGPYQSPGFQGCYGAQQSMGSSQVPGQNLNQQLVSSQMSGAYGMPGSSNLLGVGFNQNGGNLGGLTPQMSCTKMF